MQARALEEKIEGERVELEHEGELCRRIRWIIKEFALDIQTIRARLVNNLETPMQQAMDQAKASTKEKKRTKHLRELS